MQTMTVMTRPAVRSHQCHAWLVVLSVMQFLLPAADSSAGDLGYAAVKAAVFSDPYAARPQYTVTARLFGPGGDDPANALRAAAARTLTSDADLVDFAHGQKLFQPNGICYAANWQIDADSPFSGVFAATTRLAAIVRISVMLGEVRRGARRTLGMGIKLFVDASGGERSVDVLVMDAIAGSSRAHVAAARLDNAPDYGGLPPLGSWGTALRIRRDLETVDGKLSSAGPNLRYRSLDHLAAAGLSGAATPRAPHWIRLSTAPGTAAVEAEDFRDELALRHYPGNRLVYRIEAAAYAEGGKSAAEWQQLGQLELVEDVVSYSCDARVHFSHPRLDRDAHPPP